MAALEEQKLVFHYQTIIRKLKEQQKAALIELKVSYQKKLDELRNENTQLRGLLPTTTVAEPAVEPTEEPRKSRKKTTDAI